MGPVTWRFVLLGALAACGDGIAIPDAPMHDSAARELVTFEVRSARIGSGARVLITDRDSNLVATATTDAGGRGNAYVPDAVLSVTIELSGTAFNERWLYTIPNVRPGDNVELDDGTLVETTTVTVKVAPFMGAVSGYQLETPCGSSTLEADLPTNVFLTNCGTDADMLVLWNSNNYLYRADVGIIANGAINLAGEYKQLSQTLIRVVKPRPTTFQVHVQQMLLDGSRPLAVVPGFGFLNFDGFTTSAEANFTTPTWPNARVLTRLDEFSSSGIGSNTVLAWGERTEPTEIELDRDLPRAMLNFPRYDPATGIVSWLERDQGRRADAALVAVGWIQRDGTNVHWRMFVERTNNARIAFPRLPGGMYRPESAYVEHLTNFTIDGGYERLRKLPILGQWEPNAFRWNAWIIDAPEGRLNYESTGASGGLPDG
jgi:hypothetical protein